MSASDNHRLLPQQSMSSTGT